jgi:hypothetical protein
MFGFDHERTKMVQEVLTRFKIPVMKYPITDAAQATDPKRSHG